MSSDPLGKQSSALSGLSVPASGDGNGGSKEDGKGGSK